MLRRNQVRTILILTATIIFILVHTPYYLEISRSFQNTTYPYLSHRLFAENQNDILINFIPLRQQLREYVTTHKEKLGVFFEYLPTGTSIGVNEKEEHVFASLFKVPLVMAYYLQTEAEHTPFDQTFTITEDQLDKNSGDLWRQGAGTKITTRELIEEILVNSDNTATNALADFVKVEYMQKVFSGLDIFIARDQNQQQTITPKSYSSIFKSLYLSAILPYHQSQEILDILTKSSDTHALRRSLPTDLKVAHKFGVYGDNLYWDCGIVYVPKRPYSLCIFSEEYTDHAKTEIGFISKMVYDYVSSANRPTN